MNAASQNYKLTRHHFVLFTILLLGLFLRVYNLSSESIWLDEGVSIRLAHLTPSEIIEDRTSNVHSPLYFLILHYWVKHFGDSGFAVRFWKMSLITTLSEMT